MSLFLYVCEFEYKLVSLGSLLSPSPHPERVQHVELLGWGIRESQVLLALNAQHKLGETDYTCHEKKKN